MADDLSDGFAQVRKLQKEVRRLQNARPLENSSVTNGRLRFISGLLLIDSGGTLQVIGQLFGEGQFRWVGPWRLEGPGTITGNVNQTGNTTQQGNVTLTGGGKVTAGNVTVEPNRVTVGSAWLENGELVLSNGAKVAVGLTGGTSSIGLVPGGSADISVNTLTAWLRATGAAISVTTAQARIAAPTIILDSLPTGAPSGAKAVLVDPSNGKLYRGVIDIGSLRFHCTTIEGTLMFSEKYDDIRTILSNAQTNALQLSMELSQAHIDNGGPGLSPNQQHAVIAKLTAEVHNLALAMGNLVDQIEQDGVGVASDPDPDPAAEEE